MRALERLISRMCLHMSLERSGGRKVAPVTFEQLFSGMSEHVVLKATRLCTGEVTMCAMVRLSPCVRPHVCLQTTSMSARVDASCATKGFFS